jgi:hypothetical protein
MSKVYLEVSLGSPTAYSHLLEQHEKLCSWLKSNAASYGLPEDLKELDEVGRETVLSCFSGENVSLFYFLICSTDLHLSCMLILQNVPIRPHALLR